MRTAEKCKELLMNCSNSSLLMLQATYDDMGAITLAFGLPLYWKKPIWDQVRSKGHFISTMPYFQTILKSKKIFKNLEVDSLCSIWKYESFALKKPTLCRWRAADRELSRRTSRRGGGTWRRWRTMRRQGERDLIVEILFRLTQRPFTHYHAFINFIELLTYCMLQKISRIEHCRARLFLLHCFASR